MVHKRTFNMGGLRVLFQLTGHTMGLSDGWAHVFEARHGQCLIKAGPVAVLPIYLLVPCTYGTILNHQRVLVFGSEPMVLFLLYICPLQQPLP